MKHTPVTGAPALPLPAFAPLNNNWDLDEAHAKLRFSITHFGISDVEGTFNTITAKITATREDLSDAVVEFTADAKSVDTHNRMRDEHLRNADFFEVEKYPSITYTSTSFTKVGEGKYKVQGNLTLKGVTKPVDLDASVRYATNPMTQKQMAGFKVTGIVDRTQFSVGSGFGGASLSDQVEFTTNAEFVKQ
jgi:polyisoprenoid-binding protein YceI